ncbi:MAG: hypothetical protein ABI142_04315 [Bryocella sp.]
METAEGRWLLYDKTADLYQVNNLASDPKNKDLMAGFDREIRSWIRSTGYTFPYPVEL